MAAFPKEIARLSRAYDGGKFALAVLGLSLGAGALAAAAEFAGLDGLCVTGDDEAVFGVLVGLCSICLVLDYLLRRSPSAWVPLAAGIVSCLAFVMYFPLTPLSALAAAAYAALPLALYLPFPRSLVLSAASTAGFALLRLWAYPPEASGMRPASFRDSLVLVLVPLGSGALAAAAAAFRSEAGRTAEALMEVTRLNLSYQSYSASLEEKTALEERLRLTRDLHDVVGYALTNTIMTLRAASLMCAREPERVPGFLDAARADAEGALERVRGMLGDIRKREIRYVAGSASIARAVRTFKAATGVEVDLDYGNFGWSLGGNSALAVSHFVQEGMLNAVSHGKASAIRVSFHEAEGTLRVSVKDNGEGAEAVQEGIGIAGMRERIEGLGGSLEYGSSASGFSIEMSLPLEVRGPSGLEAGAGTAPGAGTTAAPDAALGGESP